MMDRLFVTGGARLAGSVRVSGAKNSALKLMAASLLAPGRSVVRNVPRIRDCGVMAEMLEHFGVRVSLRDGVAELDATHVDDVEAPDELVRQMRASIVVLGPLLARCGRAQVSMPGGDEIGARPVDLHVRGLERMGATIRFEHGFLLAEADELRGAPITLDYPSVTATENLLFAAVRARGVTVIDNAAREPEIAAVASCLVAMGARLQGAGSSTIEIEGVDELRPSDHTAVPDRIEAGTWAAAAVATQGDVTIENARPEHLELFLSKLRDAGTEVSVSDAGLRIRQSTRARAVDFVTLPYPGIATDFQPILLAMLATGEGTAIVTENVFESRFLYVGELLRMGADIRTEGHHAVIRGVPRLSAAPVRALDIRAGAAMVIAALCADGVTEIADMQHVDRGYEDFEAKLEALGAEVRRERELVTLP
ncbi:MAG: UDP-N-acetylglucosamine 1-carboxyvinyltransferase [Actinomycetota bacterium]